jgi:hypothetical protein
MSKVNEEYRFMFPTRVASTVTFLRLFALLCLTASLIAGTVAYATPPAGRVFDPPSAGPCDGDPGGADCLNFMAAIPGPPGETIGVNMGVVAGYEFLRVEVTPANVYNGPYGGDRVLYTFEKGYHFITPRQKIGPWYEINVGEWLNERHLVAVDPSYFRGVALTGAPAMPFGWILRTHYASEVPGGPPVQLEDRRVVRYTRVNVYAMRVVDGWRWYLVGPNKWVHQTKMGVAYPIGPPAGAGGRWVGIDLYEQVLIAYEGSTMAFATLVSSGLPGWDTRTGLFHVYGRRINAPMSGAEGREDAYRLENVPYAMYFDGQISLHGTYWHNGFGYRQSHGCVNLTVSDAAWLWDWLGNGSVYVYYSQSY